MICSVAEVLTYLRLASTATDAQRALITMLLPLGEVALKSFLGFSVEQATFTHYLPVNPLGGEQGGSDYIDVVGGQVVFGGAFSDTDQIALPEIPVRSITSLYEDMNSYAGSSVNDFAAATLQTEGTHFYLDRDESGISRSGILFKIGSTWSAKPRTIKCTYVAGYTAAELDGSGTNGFPASVQPQLLKLAAIMTVVGEYNRALAQSGNAPNQISSEGISAGGYNVSYSTQGKFDADYTMEIPEAAKRICAPFMRMFKR